MRLGKDQLTKLIRQRVKISPKLLDKVFAATFDVVADTLANGDEVVINRLGLFTHRKVRARRYWIQRQNRFINKPDRLAVKFKQSQLLKVRLECKTTPS